MLQCRLTENAFGNEDNLDGGGGRRRVVSIHRSIDVKAAALCRAVRYAFIVVVVGRGLACSARASLNTFTK